MSSCKISREQMLAALVERQGKENVAKLQAATVAVCGLGGLGSNIAISLARAGVGKLILIDFDTVDVTNLHRQQYKVSQVGEEKSIALAENLKEIAPYLEIESHTERMIPENVETLIGQANVVCEAFDNPEAKAMLVNAILERNAELASQGNLDKQQFLVAASGMAGFGEANEITTRRISKKFFLCGDGKSDVNAGIGLIAPRVMLCAAHQAITTIRIICGFETETLSSGPMMSSRQLKESSRQLNVSC